MHEVETMAYANEVPWHGLGTQVDDNLTPIEMLKAAGLDWRVSKQPMRAVMDDGTTIEVPNKMALVRDKDNKVMTICSPGWHPVQNEDVLGFMRDYVAAGGATLETAGSLRGGTVIWGLAALKHSFEVRRGDAVRGYLLFTSSHRVGMATDIRTTGVRVVCANTLAFAHSASTVNYKQNHLSEFDVEAAKARVAEAHEELAAAEQRAKTIAGLKLDIKTAVRDVIAPVFMPELVAEDAEVSLDDVLASPENQPRTLQELIHSINNGPGAEPGTGWGVLNGVTHWADHMAGRNSASRMHSAWLGQNATRKEQVEQKLLELAA